MTRQAQEHCRNDDKTRHQEVYGIHSQGHIARANHVLFVATGAPQPSEGVVTDVDEWIEPSSGSDRESDSEESTDGARMVSRAKSSAKSRVTSNTTSRATSSVTSESTSGMTTSSATDGLTKINFQTQPNMPGLSIEQDNRFKNDREELYRLHVRMGHLLFYK
jgi:hypothetical protein